MALFEHFIVDTPPDAHTLTTACGTTVPAFPIPPDGLPLCPTCLGLVTSGAIS